MKLLAPLFVALVGGAGCVSQQENVKGVSTALAPSNRTSPPPLSLAKTEVAKVSGTGVLGHEDTDVTVTVKYLGDIPKDQRNNLRWTWQDPMLVDERGQEYTRSDWRGDYSFLQGAGTDSYERTFKIDLSKVPQDIKKLTFKTSLSVDNSPSLPIFVVVLDGKRRSISKRDSS